MLASLTGNFVFLKPTKVAGSSIEGLLSLHCGGDDVIVPSSIYQDEMVLRGVTPQNWTVPFFRAPRRQLLSMLGRGHKLEFHSHSTAKFARKYLPEKFWEGSLKVSVSRNPFDRIVSWYFWDEKCGARAGTTFQEYVLRYPRRLTSVRRQTHIDGEEVIDFYLRFDSLKTDYALLEKTLGLENSYSHLLDSLRLKGGNRPKDSSPQRMFDGFAEGIDLVESLCAEEIEAFGYTLENAKLER
jgi:hypothetical protein